MPNVSFSAILLLTTNVVLTLLSVYWAVSAWSALKSAKAESPWPQTDCLIISKSLTNRSDTYRPQFRVSNISITHPDLEGTAYRYSKPVFNETLESANAYLDTKKLNHTYNCWLSSDEPNILSMSIVHVGVRSEHANIAAISTVLAIAALFSLGAIIYLLGFSSPPITLTEIITHPTNASRSGLPRQTIDDIITTAEAFHSSSSQAPSEEPVCAICLEDGNEARLPCTHAFHSLCIRTWLLRGGETCPLCCASVSPLHDERYNEEQEDRVDTIYELTGTAGRAATGRFSSTRFPSLNLSRSHQNIAIDSMPGEVIARITAQTAEDSQSLSSDNEIASEVEARECNKSDNDVNASNGANN